MNNRRAAVIALGALLCTCTCDRPHRGALTHGLHNHLAETSVTVTYDAEASIVLPVSDVPVRFQLILPRLEVSQGEQREQSAPVVVLGVAARDSASGSTVGFILSESCIYALAVETCIDRDLSRGLRVVFDLVADPHGEEVNVNPFNVRALFWY